MDFNIALNDILVAIMIAALIGGFKYIRSSTGLIKKEVHELREWHKPLPDGSFQWHKSEDLGVLLERLTKCIENQTRIMDAIHSDIKEHRRTSDKIEEMMIVSLREGRIPK